MQRDVTACRWSVQMRAASGCELAGEEHLAHPLGKLRDDHARELQDHSAARDPELFFNL
jgi:hypothetical protein